MPIFRTPYFSPLNVSGCVLWFDAEDTKTMTFSGSTVTSWTSKGSSTVSTSVVSGSTNPTYTTYNNLPALGFNGTSTFIQTANVSVPGTGTTWITCSVNLTPVTASTPVDSSIVLATNAPGERAIRYSATGANTYYTINRNLTNTADLLRGQINENANGIRGFMDTASYFTGFTNGTQTVSNTNAVTYVAPANQPFLMGKWASGYLNGYIYESLVYNRVLTLEEYQQVEGYLAQKWGFTASLPANHPFLRILLYRWKVPLARLPYYKVYDPRAISSLVLWLDGVDPAGNGVIPANGATVSTWADKSGNGYNAAATGTSTYLTGGGVNFTGSSYFLNQTFSQNLSQRSIFIVFQETTNTQFAGVLTIIPTPNSGNDQSTTNGLSSETTSNSLFFVGNSTGYQSQIGNANPLPKAIYYDSMNGTIGSGFLNGTNATNVTASYTAGTCSGYGLGGRWQGGSMSGLYRLNGVIFEIMYFNSPLGLSDRRNIEGYLAQKWGLTGSLPVDHPSLTVPVGAPATGIGKQTISYYSRAPPVYGSVQFTYLPISPYAENQYLSASVTAPSTDSVTYECWFYQTTQNSGNNSIFSSRTGGGGNGGIQVGINSYWGGFSLATPTFLANYGFAPSLNTWHHIALVRNGTSAWTFYYDGIAKTSDQGATFTFTSTTSTDIFIGAFADSGYPQQFTGHVTNFRYVKGVAVYTGNFTVPTIALTVTQSAGTNISAITAGQTQLLLLQASTGLLTDTANNTTVTNTGTATWNALTPF